MSEQQSCFRQENMWQHSSSGCSLPVTRPSINHSSSIFTVFAGARWSSGIRFGFYKWRQTVQINKTRTRLESTSVFHQGTKKSNGSLSIFIASLTSFPLKSTVSCCQVTLLKGNNGVWLGNTVKSLQTTCLGKVSTLCRHSKLSGFTLFCFFFILACHYTYIARGD